MNPIRKKIIQLTLASLFLLAGILAPNVSVRTVEAKSKIDAQDFHDAMRKLWEDHITWTRLVIISTFADLPDLEPTTQRLCLNRRSQSFLLTWKSVICIPSGSWSRTL